MIVESRFKIIFVKLAEALAKQNAPMPGETPREASSEEMDELDELRRLVLEITEPEPTSYTTT